MTGARFLAVKNFETYQHYHDRTPPWIKLYNSLLDDYRFLQLTEQSQIHLVKLWLLASRHENRIPNDLVYISGKLLPKSAIDIEELIVAGFLIATDEPAKRKAKQKARKPRSDRGIQRKQNASKMLAPRYQDARLEGEGEREGEIEKEKIKIFPAPRDPNWVAEATDILAAVGSFSHGRVGKALGPSVKRHGWPDTKKGLGDYVAAHMPGRRKTPEYFAQEDAVWIDGARMDFADETGVPTARADRVWGVAR